jgi:hypothetical protein
MNNGMVEQLAAEFAKRVRRDAGGYPARQVEAVYMIALSRSPTAEEKSLGIASLEALADVWEKQLTGEGIRDAAELKALATYCHALMNSAAFLYID